jgi:predicted XRE-type DNA-binding protein
MKVRTRGEARRSLKSAARSTGTAPRRILSPEENAVHQEIRSTLLRGLEQWLANAGMTQVEAAKVLSVTQARVSDIKRGKIHQFSLDLLVRLADRAGLRPRMTVTKKRRRAVAG